MLIATRTFRVFVSSTFEDLKEERDALQRDVFPKLRTLCEQHGARFQAIDLRWGVRDEAALDQQTMEICLREIQRCRATGVRPNFIALLGDRYGWQPLPPTILATEFDSLKPHLAEGDVMAAERWYRLDENADPPEYCLQPRTDEFVDPDAWRKEEQELREALAMAARAAALSKKELIKYEASATHQEILAGLDDSEEDRQHVFGFVRRPAGNADPRLDALKSRLRMHEFDADDMNGLCELVLTQITKVIQAEVKRFEDRPALDLEIEAHDRFAEQRCRIFTGRETLLDTIADYIRGSERRPLVLHGESGSGKSAVMAKASQLYNGAGRMIRRFIGASPESASGHALLTSLCRHIAPGETPVDYAQLENAFRERLSVATAEQPLVLFIDALDQLAASDPARDVTWLPPELPPHVKVILSTTDDRERLPAGLPVRLERMAQSEGGQALDELLRDARRTLQSWQRETVLAHFERCGLPLYLKLAAEESQLWKSYTSRDACTLGEGVAGVIDTLFDRLATNANHGPTLVESSLGYLAAARYGLTEDEVLDVLTADDAVWSDFDQRKHHEVSERRLPVVVWSRLSLDLEPYLTERAAPGGTIITFYHRQLAEHAANKSSLVGDPSGHYHSSLARYFAAQPYWLDSGRGSPNARKASEIVHQQLAASLLDQAVETLTDLQFVAASCAAGLVFEMQGDYRNTLFASPAMQQDLEHIAQQRTELALWASTLADCAHARRLPQAQEIIRPAMPQANERTQNAPRTVNEPGPFDRLRVFADFVTRECYPLLKFGTAFDFTIQHAFNYSPGGPVHQAAARIVETTANLHALLRQWPASAEHNPVPAIVRVLEGHSDAITAVSVSPDGRRALSASSDGTLRLWDLETGECIRVLVGHSARVEALSVTADWKWALSVASGKDDTIRFWDLETGECLRVIPEYVNSARALCIAPNGVHGVSATVTYDYTSLIKIWSLKTGDCVRELTGHQAGVTALSITPDGKRLISGGVDKSLRVWDLDTGRCLLLLEGHESEVDGLTLTTDGLGAVSWAKGNVRVWDLEKGTCKRTLEWDTSSVVCASRTPRGLQVITVGPGDQLQIKDIDYDAPLKVIDGHFGMFWHVSVTADHRRAVSGGGDNKLIVWNLEAGQSLLDPYRHATLDGGFSNGVSGLKVTQDGQVAVSAGNKTLLMWDVKSSACVKALEVHYDDSNSKSIFGLDISPRGHRAVSIGLSTLKVWDLVAGECTRTLWSPTYLSSVSMVGECHVILGFIDGFLEIWDLTATGEALRGGRASTVVWRSKERAHSVTSVAVSRDGDYALSGSYEWDSAIRVWNLRSGLCEGRLEGHKGAIFALWISPDGRFAASGSNDQTVRVWDVISKNCLAVLSGHSGTILSVALTSDGRRVVSGSHDGTVRVWDIAAKSCVVNTHVAAACNELDISDALNRVIVGTSTGEVIFFDASLAQAATSTAGRCESDVPRSDIPAPHLAAGPKKGRKLNLECIEAMGKRKQPSWWKRFITKPPTPPTGI